MSGAEAALLYFRSFEPCELSTQDAVDLPGGRRLLYPLRVEQPITTAAYLITREACERLYELVVPVRAAADSWAHFHVEGAVERLRCVTPCVAHVRTDFKSTLGYDAARSLRSRVSTAVSRNRLPPFHQALTAYRNRLERRMSRVSLVDAPSPLAPAARAS
jgi:hypothetical protein